MTSRKLYLIKQDREKPMKCSGEVEKKFERKRSKTRKCILRKHKETRCGWNRERHLMFRLFRNGRFEKILLAAQ